MESMDGFSTYITIFLVVEMIAGVLCSSSVLFISWRKKQMKNTPNALLVNLAGIDLLLCCGGIPITAISLARFRRNSLLFHCFHEALTSSLRNASLITLLLISYYRYWSVTHPFKVRINFGRARKLLYISWLITLFSASVPFIELHFRDTASLYAASYDTWFRNSSHGLYFRVYYFPVFILTCAILLPSYYKISRAALFRLQLQTMTKASVFLAPAVIQMRNKEGDILARRKKRRVVKLTGAIICSVCGLWLPYTAISFVMYFVEPSLALSRLEFVFLVLGYFNCVLNPVLYAFTKRKFRKALISSLPWKRYVEQDNTPNL